MARDFRGVVAWRCGCSVKGTVGVRGSGCALLRLRPPPPQTLIAGIALRARWVRRTLVLGWRAADWRMLRRHYRARASLTSWLREDPCSGSDRQIDRTLECPCGTQTICRFSRLTPSPRVECRACEACRHWRGGQESTVRGAKWTALARARKEPSRGINRRPPQRLPQIG